MKTIFRIFLSDIKKIRTNLMAFAVMIGICILLSAVCVVQHCGKLGSVLKYRQYQDCGRKLR